MAPHHEPTLTATRAPPPHRISSWPFIYEPMHKIRTWAYPFTDLICTIDPITDAHRLMSLIHLWTKVHGLGLCIHKPNPRLFLKKNNSKNHRNPLDVVISQKDPFSLFYFHFSPCNFTKTSPNLSKIMFSFLKLCIYVLV
jgi:hypothetical protein